MFYLKLDTEGYWNKPINCNHGEKIEIERLHAEDSIDSVSKIFERCAEGDVGLEFALPSDDSVFKLARDMLPSIPNKIVHLEHETRLQHIGNPAHLEDLMRQIEMSKLLGFGCGVLHFQDTHDPSIADEDQLLGLLKEADVIAKENDFVVFIENTIESPQWIRRHIELCDSFEFKNIGLCFDCGHAKCMGPKDFDIADWVEVCRFARGLGVPLHFHVHTNHGFNDDHFSLVEAEHLSLLNPEGFFVNGFAEYLSAIHSEFGGGHSMTLESEGRLALLNLEKVVHLVDCKRALM